MADILEEIVAYKRLEVDEFKQIITPENLYNMVEQKMQDLEKFASPVCSMRKALMASDTGIISEFKRKSPSKGWIHRDAKPSEVTIAYQENGAAALSILTDMKYFGGDDEFIRQARAVGVTIPILYKNFIIDEYQLFQARLCGASAVLLIAADLTKEECRSLLHKAHELGLEVLLEMHQERDFDYVDLEPDMYGINNRHLGTFHTNVKSSIKLVSRLPEQVCKVSESGIHDAKTVERLRQVGFNGFLMGEYFMKEAEPGKALADFIAQFRARQAR
ncbi:MAG: indole-3-glycerol phosphate synthase TrpC [Prevotella sp.]|jgi:indole-3-glycerol phosphate synthase|nr:indole-3-glycerol phosphate synthase TrpC [Prevotella sp.]